MVRKLLILVCVTAAAAYAGQFIVGSPETPVKAPFSAC